MRAIIPLTLIVSACAPAQPPVTPDPVAGACQTEALAGMLGWRWSDARRGEALRVSGARSLRVIRPGDAVTMDFRADRLNVHLDARGQVDRFACG